MTTQRLPRQTGLAAARPVRYRRLPVPDVSTGSAVCEPTAVWLDTFGMDDFLQILYRVNFQDSLGMTEEGIGVKLGLLDTFGLADSLQVIESNSFADSFGMSDGALGVVTKLFETLGLDDRLQFVTLLSTMLDTFGMDDRLTLAQVVGAFADTLGMDDRLAFVDVFTNQLDTIGVTEDALGIKAGLFDSLALTDDLISVVKPTSVDTLATDDAFTKAQIRNWTCSRSGTPDTDPGCDCYIDQLAANAGTNFGNVSPLKVKGKSTLANDEQRGLMEFDFTRFAGMTAFVGGTHTFTIKATNPDLLLVADLSVTITRLAARPFTESTLTWNTAPAGGPTPGTLIVSKGENIPANSTMTFVVTLTDAQMNDLLGDWAYVRMLGLSSAAPITISVASREDADLADKPRWDFDLKR